MLVVGTRTALFVVLCCGLSGTLDAATFSTPNFHVTAESQELAERVGKLAEHYRHELAIKWLGKPMPQWFRPCTIDVKVGRLGAGGATTFQFDRGEVYGWRMEIQGSVERVLDSVLPHEVNHTIFATYFRRPLPRWADEGAATLTEHESEKNRQRMLLGEVMQSNERFPMRQLLAMTEYPSGGNRRVLTMYAQGWSLADYLVQQGGRAKFLKFLDDAHRRGWDRAIATHYDFEGVDNLEEEWTGWVTAGSPSVVPEGTLLAGSEGAVGEDVVVRGQSPDDAPLWVLPEEDNARAAAEEAARETAAVPPRNAVDARIEWQPTDRERLARPRPLAPYRQPLKR